MRSEEWPVLVEHYEGHQALTIICEACYAEEIIHASDLLNDGLYSCPRRCGGYAFHKYEEADACRSCKTLSHDIDPSGPLKGCCSRVCLLQAEYAESLKAVGRTP